MENNNNPTIKIKVPELLYKRKITVTQLRNRAEIGGATAYALANSENPPKRVDLNTLAKLCSFFGCGISDILEYVE